MFRILFPSILVLAVAVGGSAMWLQSRNDISNLAAIQGLDAVVDVQATEEAKAITEMTLGAEDAPVTIIEYASFTCPHCANFHAGVFKKLKTEYIDTGKVHFVMRDVYFDRYGLWAALLARCDGPGKFFGVSDLIYTKQKEWTKGKTNLDVVQNLMKLGRLAGMTDEQMNACMQDENNAKALVAEFQKNAEADGITSTPSFIINGEAFGNASYEEFKDKIDGLLAE